ncbi:MAG: TIGR01459 family HAD-type hydrolase [bacterium]
MENLAIIDGLHEIAGDYDALLCDAWGVIHNGVTLSPGIEEALSSFRQNCGPVLILTNAPRPNHIIPPQLDNLGLPRHAYDGVVTSGDVTQQAVLQQHGRPAFRLGPSKDDALYAAFDTEFTSLEKSAYILCTGLFDDENETPEDYVALFQTALERDLPMICANPDIIVHRGDQVLYCGGALAQLYEKMGGRVTLCGKPYAPIYDICRSRFKEISNGIEPKKILAIGDGLDTDIKGANDQNIDVVFVAGGIFRDMITGPDGHLSQHALYTLLAKHEVSAIAAMERFIW